MAGIMIFHIVPTIIPTTAPATKPAPTAAPAPTAIPVPDLVIGVKNALKGNTALVGIPITVEQRGLTIDLVGVIPSLRLRYLAETTAAGVPGVANISTQRLTLSNTYAVKAGEGVWDIASKVYGSPLFWRTIAKANALEAPYVLHIGQILILPEL